MGWDAFHAQLENIQSDWIRRLVELGRTEFDGAGEALCEPEAGAELRIAGPGQVG